MKIQIISLFPDMFPKVLETSMLYKAQQRGIVGYEYINLRDFGIGPRKQVDDTPYGGGDGMLLKPEPIFEAIQFAKHKSPRAKTILMTPRGTRLTQVMVRVMAQEANDVIILCAHYEGYDERITTLIDQQISIGNYILTGGELPAMVLIDSVVRLLPGVLGGENSAAIESFSHGKNFEFPQYTRPEVYKDLAVPKVLLNGNHAEIAKWRANHSKSE